MKSRYTFVIEKQQHTCRKEKIEEILSLLAQLEEHDLKFKVIIHK